MFSQFAEGEKMSSAIFSSDVMHMFCLQLLVCLDTFFGPERLTRVRMAYRVWLFIFVTRGYIYIYIFIYGATNVGAKKTKSFNTAGFLNDK